LESHSDRTVSSKQNQKPFQISKFLKDIRSIDSISMKKMLVKNMYLIVIKNNYLKIGLLLLVASGIIAIYLNNEGFNCLSKLNRREVDSFHAAGETSEGLAGYCFFVTNSYVYSLFGIIIGASIIAFWYCKYRNIWHTKYKK
jgi:hypothetical protein